MDKKLISNKIASISPGQKHLQLQFQISEIISQDGSSLLCRIVDDTGIATALFDKYTEKLQKDSYYLMTNLKSKVISNHIQIHMSKSTVISKEPTTLGFLDRSNDISKQFYVEKSEQKQQTTDKQREYLLEEEKKTQSLIPFSREQARQEIRLKKQFDKERKKTSKPETKPYKNKQQQGKYKEKKTNQAQKYIEKEKNSKPPKFKEKEEEIQKNQDKKVKYILKQSENQDQNKEENNESVSQHNQQPQPIPAQKPQPETKAQESSQPKKQSNEQHILLSNVIEHINGYVNVRVWVSPNHRNESENGFSCLVADKTGSLWAKFSKEISIEGDNWYQIDNLEVAMQGQAIILKLTDISEAKTCLHSELNFDLKPIKK